MKLYVKLLFLVGGSEKNEINAILNSKLKLELVEVEVELGKKFQMYCIRIIMFAPLSFVGKYPLL